MLAEAEGNVNFAFSNASDAEFADNPACARATP